jgi:putative heme-binding domain-containing protein
MQCGRWALAVVALWLLGQTLGSAQAQRLRNPLRSDPETIRRGSLFYRARCAGCHGLDGKGVSGPDLTAALAAGMSDERFFQTIRRGVPGTEMPAFDAEHNADTQVWEILAHLRTLTSGGTQTPVKGDVATGTTLFRTNCASCHTVAGRGGHLGPDLTRIGSARSASALAAKIRTPNRNILAGFQPVTVVLADGKRIRGTRKNEDAFSIQIMDTSERLQGFRKADVQEIVREPRSLMPEFETDRLNDQNVNDLVTYLVTLRPPAAAGATTAAPRR